MRGKKTDPEFISKYISECTERRGFITPEEILQAAKNDIKNIDDKIKEVEALKVIRSKILDVIAIFSKPENKEEEAKLLPFFQLQYPHICKFICNNLKLGSIPIKIIDDTDGHDADYKFCIKQLIEHKIVAKTNNEMMRGERFDEYMKFVLRETE